ncbi:uncharacterized protein LOC116841660 [Odontomachus brunneus]|uniref:uncharacterized protein LOC116841660 n=1 Tax=Odontomachus brunneus TaxID=486640 RepID=UPI0013F219AD|nr:uncharacterized protein LOC116841660 [Odontomachus brunneus]
MSFHRVSRYFAKYSRTFEKILASIATRGNRSFSIYPALVILSTPLNSACYCPSQPIVLITREVQVLTGVFLWPIWQRLTSARTSRVEIDYNGVRDCYIRRVLGQ